MKLPTRKESKPSRHDYSQTQSELDESVEEISLNRIPEMNGYCFEHDKEYLETNQPEKSKFYALNNGSVSNSNEYDENPVQYMDDSSVQNISNSQLRSMLSNAGLTSMKTTFEKIKAKYYKYKDIQKIESAIQRFSEKNEDLNTSEKEMPKVQSQPNLNANNAEFYLDSGFRLFSGQNSQKQEDTELRSLVPKDPILFPVLLHDAPEKYKTKISKRLRRKLRRKAKKLVDNPGIMQTERLIKLVKRKATSTHKGKQKDVYKPSKHERLQISRLQNLSSTREKIQVKPVGSMCRTKPGTGFGSLPSITASTTKAISESPFKLGNESKEKWEEKKTVENMKVKTSKSKKKQIRKVRKHKRAKTSILA